MLEPVKLGYAGVSLFFLFLPQNIDCGYSLEPPRQVGFKGVYITWICFPDGRGHGFDPGFHSLADETLHAYCLHMTSVVSGDLMLK